MILTYGIIAWLGLIGYGVSSKLPDCIDRIGETVKADNLSNAKVKIEQYPFGVSILFSKDGHKYDYFFTDNQTQISEAVQHGYIEMGKCELNNQPVYFLHGHVDTTQGA